MPRRRRKRRGAEEEGFVDPPLDEPAAEDVVEEEEGDRPPEETREQPAPDGDDSETEWPEWAYRSRPRSERRGRKRSRRGKRRRREASPAPATEEEETGSFFDQTSAGASFEEPAVWVSEEATESAAAFEVDGEDRLTELPDDSFSEDDVAPAVIVEEVEAADLAYGDEYEEYDESEDRGAQEDDDERSYQSVIGDVVPGGVGPRRAALHERQRQRRRSTWIAVAATLAVIAVGFFVLTDEDGAGDDDDRSGAVVATNQDDSVESMLLYGTHEDDPAAGATWLALLSIDHEANAGSIVYVPAHTAVEVPGRGVLPLGESIAGEDVPLLLVSTESLLGIDVDRYLEMSDSDARVLFQGLSALEVNVPLEVSIPAGPNQTRLLFGQGPQVVEGDGLVQLLFTIGVDGDDVELGSRHLAFWDALFETYADRSEELEQAVLSAGGALGESDRSVEENAEFLGDFAALPEDSVVLTTLPVNQAGVGDQELYQPDDEVLRSFIQDTTGARSTLGDEIRVQILNGNGIPGIGDDVAKLLVGEGFRVIISGNAQRLNYRETLIIAYDRAETGLAERARELLGLGEVQVSAQEQGIVDLTIVVGKDFLERN
jgi:hypothetical protein